MDQKDLVNVLIIFSHAFLGVYLMMLTEFREPRRAWMLRWGVSAAMIIVANALICIIFGREKWAAVMLLTLTAPFVIITLVCSRRKLMHAMFSLCTCLWIGCVVFSVAEIANTLTNGNMWIRLFAQIAAYAAMYFVVRWFRPYYLRMIHLLDKGWGVMCAIPAVTFLTVVFTINSLLDTHTLAAVVTVCGVTLLCTCSYLVIYLFFVKTIDDYELKNSRDIAEVRRNALKRQLDESEDAEKAMEEQCRDMLRRWETLERLVENDDSAAISELVGAAQKKLDESVSVRWCENQMMNAMFAVYFFDAQRSGIEVEAKLDLPEELPIPPAELSTVFANALENAINACKAVHQGKRKIICKCVSYPQLMLKIENTFTGEVSFGSDGLPAASKEGHGIGSRSIAAFCKKYDASCSYDVSDGWFSLRIAL